ncbi:rolling pebbles-like protein [Colletotrichum truncatum]|uniref:Rolling pebbles-like protein n=1 Tax=Colletotrichum truncatum TaxID=5467 RepID=A0ACC3YPA5_COLTU
MCKTRLKRWGFAKNNSKNRKTSFRHDIKPAKSQNLLKRAAVRLRKRKSEEGHTMECTPMETDAEIIYDESHQEEPTDEEFHDDETQSIFPICDPSPSAETSSEHTHQASGSDTEVDSINQDVIMLGADKMLFHELVPSEAPELVISRDAVDNIYEEVCPYRYGDKKFRLIEEFESGEQYYTDSLGFGMHIKESALRFCSANCPCKGAHFPADFSFLVTASKNNVQVRFLSDALWSEIISVLPWHERPKCEYRDIDARTLFHDREALKKQLEKVYSAALGSSESQEAMSLSLEMELLVYGLLNEHMFKVNGNDLRVPIFRFGDFTPWDNSRPPRTWHETPNKLETQIDRLDEAFRDTSQIYEMYAGDMGSGMRYELDSTPFCAELHGAGLTTDRDAVSKSCKESDEFIYYKRTVISSEAFELDSRQLKTREEFTISKAKNVERKAFTVKDSRVSPVMTKKLEEGTFSVNDWIMNAAMGGDISLVQALLDLGTDTDGKLISLDHVGEAQLLTIISPVFEIDCSKSPLCIAAEFGDIRVARALISRGADVNKKDQQDRAPIYLAAANGHKEVVLLLFEHGANLNTRGELGSLLNASSINGHHEILRVLLNRHYGLAKRAESSSSQSLFRDERREMEEALVQAATSGSPATMQVLLDHGAKADRLLSTPGSKLLPALIGSAASGNYEVVNILLQTKVDVSGVDHRGTALSAAVSNGHDAIARLLLTHAGGQVLAAIRHLRACGKRIHIARLIKIVSQIQRDQRDGRDLSPRGMVCTTTIQSLWKRFLRQHSIMLTAASKSSTKFKELSSRLSDYRDGWTAGINAMRRLCRGEIPVSIHDTIPFLSLARAMVEALDGFHHSDYMVDFNSDLKRWQMLFTSEDKATELEAYRDAVWSMWGVQVTFDSTENLDTDDTVLQRFHDLAATLATKADAFLGGGPLSNADVIMNEPARLFEATPYHGETTEHSDDRYQHREKDRIPKLQQPTPPEQPGEPPSRTLAEEIKKDPTILEPLATLLIAGAIFAIIIIFIQVMAKLAQLSVSLRVAFPSVKTLTQRYHILESELVKGNSLVHIEGIQGSTYCII